MKLPKTEKLIIKYLSNSITAAELDKLSIWVKEPENEQIFLEYIKINYAIDFNMSQFDNGKTKDVLFEHIKSKRNVFKKIKLNSVFKYAAIVIVAIGLTLFYKKNTDPKQKLIISDEVITIKLDNGDIEVIDTAGKKKIINEKGNIVGIQKGSELNYQNKENEQLTPLSHKKSKELAFNELTVPFGKKFQIILSDGTEVYLNAGTTLKYPVRFINDTERKVYLLNGEAYFDVTTDTIHPFIVSTSKMNVQVLGTEFDVSAYPEDATIRTVLVEGSVSLMGNNPTLKNSISVLKPGYKAEWSKNTNNLSISKVDTSIYTGWKNGKLIFKNMKFKNILIKLERKYNVTIINNNKELDNQYYDATFDIETIEQVLNSFNKSYKIEYTIKNNQIIIN